MSDEQILQRINDGNLIVDCATATVVGVSHCGERQLRVIERESNGSTYRFVEVCAGGKKKKIALHRLVWIAANRMIPPAGYDVDHIEGPSDCIDNLRLRPAGENRADTARTRQYASSEF